MFDYSKFATPEEAAEAAGVVALPGEYVARAVEPPPQAPQRWDVIMTGRFEDDDPPGSPA